MDNTAVDVWYEALQVLASVVAEPNVARILDDPASTAAQRAETVSAVLGNDAPEGLAQFVAVLSENHRLSLTGEVTRLFAELKASLDAATSVTLTSAFDVSDATVETLSSALKAQLGKTVDMTVKTDSTLLGGAIIRAGDMVIDGSVRGRLHKLATALKS